MSLALFTTTLAATLAPLLIPLDDPGKAMYEQKLEQELEGALAELEPSTETTFAIATRLVAPVNEPTAAPSQPAERIVPGQAPTDGAPDEAATLADWLALYCEGAGVRVVADEATLNRMRRVDVTSFGQAFNVVDSLGEFQVSYQDLLVTHGFVLTSNGAQKKYLLHDAFSNSPSNMTSYWVEPTERALMMANPAILMSTSVGVKYMDSRQASTMLRAKLPRYFEQALALSPKTLTLTTTGGKLADLLETIDRIEATEAASFQSSTGSPVTGQSGIMTGVDAGKVPSSGRAVAGGVGVAVPSLPNDTESTERATPQQLATRIYQIDSEHANDIVRTAERLVQARFNAGLGFREWIAGDGSTMPWPQPRFFPNETSTRVLVQAAAEDMARIEADLSLAKQLHDGVSKQAAVAD